MAEKCEILGKYSFVCRAVPCRPDDEFPKNYAHTEAKCCRPNANKKKLHTFRRTRKLHNSRQCACKKIQEAPKFNLANPF